MPARSLKYLEPLDAEDALQTHSSDESESPIGMTISDMMEALDMKKLFLATPDCHRMSKLRQWIKVYDKETARTLWGPDILGAFHWLFGKMVLLHNKHTRDADREFVLEGSRARWTSLPQPPGLFYAPSRDPDDSPRCWTCDTPIGDADYALDFCQQCQPSQGGYEAIAVTDRSIVLSRPWADVAEELAAGESASYVQLAYEVAALMPYTLLKDNLTDAQARATFTQAYQGVEDLIILKDVWRGFNHSERKDTLVYFLKRYNEANKRNVVTTVEESQFRWMHGKLQLMHSHALDSAEAIALEHVFVPSNEYEVGWMKLARPESFLPEIDSKNEQSHCWTCEAVLTERGRDEEGAFCSCCEPPQRIATTPIQLSQIRDPFSQNIYELHKCLTEQAMFISFPAQRRKVNLERYIRTYDEEMSALFYPASFQDAFKWLLNQVKLVHNSNVVDQSELFELPVSKKMWATTPRPASMPFDLPIPATASPVPEAPKPAERLIPPAPTRVTTTAGPPVRPTPPRATPKAPLFYTTDSEED